jgi:NAD-dependent SIR2 family protein deacetylase
LLEPPEGDFGYFTRFMNLLGEFISRSDRLVVLTGAGCSTESGIPDYRSPGGAWRRHKPIYYREFVRSEDVRRVYWARSYGVWPQFASARPNAAHSALAELESRGKVRFVITQNVDDLHQEAGSRNVLQLHGRNRVVVCLDCRSDFTRAGVQDRLAELNREWSGEFRVPACDRCGGVLKPDVVFFGESVPAEKVSVAMQRVEEGDALLVVGSSLTVWSGFRFVKRAGERGVPIAIVNIGPTRGDELATLKIEARCSEALSAAAAEVRSM